MIDEETRGAILVLAARGESARGIARALELSPNTVRKVLHSGTKRIEPLRRQSGLSEHHELIKSLYLECRGNLVRVHEELRTRHRLSLSYQALTAYCRREKIGVVERRPAGEYHFAPGEEMQHDTSPHTVLMGGVKRKLQCASLVLCYSRRVFAQCYTRFTRFECKLFLTAALRHFGGAAGRCEVDNSHVVVASGTGASAVMVPEMVAFGDRLGFVFVAHEKGDANRSAHVERRFWHIETNFYPGRSFADLADLNCQLVDWCDELFNRFNRQLGAAPRELFARECDVLRPLPVHIPDVFFPHRRQVDEQGFVNLHRNRYSAPPASINHWLDVREYQDRVVLCEGLHTIAEHPRLEPGANERSVLDAHKRKRGEGEHATRQQPIPAEERLRRAGPLIEAMVELLRRKLPGRAVRALHRLEALQRDYPEQALLPAIEEALRYGLVDIDKLESMVLQRVGSEFFKLSYPSPRHNNER